MLSVLLYLLGKWLPIIPTSAPSVIKISWFPSFQVLYLALEKRYNFSLSDMDVVANGYPHFRDYIRDEGGKSWKYFISLPE